MKPLVIVLAVLFIGLQYKLWFEKGGISEVWSLKRAITAQTQQNNEIMQANTVLAAEIQDLKNGQAAVEERARNDLGMIKPGEVFYQILNIPHHL
jgi:cell division protein FtsB